MILLTFNSPDGLRLGIKQGEDVLDVAAASKPLGINAPVTLEQVARRGREGLAKLESLAAVALDADRQPLHSLQLGPAVPRNGKIICVGLNYRHHAVESGMEIPAEPILFSKFSNAFSASGQDILITGLDQVDYEAELGVVIGRRARNIDAEDALDYVLGYCNANDVSDRKLQFKTGQWLLGKTCDGFMPTGPWLHTQTAGFDPQALEIRGWLNGELRQDSLTSDMIFSVAEIIAYISRHFTLEPGDLIITGTPMGVILGREEKDWIRPGDIYEVEITGLGRLSNRFTDR